MKAFPKTITQAFRAFLCSVCLAFSCFSRVPVFQVAWNEQNMRFMMAGFPLIGVVIGVFVWLWSLIADAASFGPLLSGAGLILIPAGVSGAIHLDGFCDVVDALSSHAKPEKKREILKDPHVGAFAPICIACYVALSIAFASELMLSAQAVLLFASIFVLSRCMSSFCVLGIRRSSDNGMLASFQIAADKKPVLTLVIVEFAGALCFCAWQNMACAAALLVVAVCVAAFVVHMARREFGGWSGDIAGFLLQTLELAFLITLVILQKVALL